MADDRERSGRHVPWLAGGGELGELMRARDWSATPLGPPDQWPQSLRSAVSILLPSRAQICLFWGPDLVALYNDAYRPALGIKHPWALARPAREMWSELWDDVLALPPKLRTWLPVAVAPGTGARAIKKVFELLARKDSRPGRPRDVELRTRGKLLGFLVEARQALAFAKVTSTLDFVKGAIAINRRIHDGVIDEGNLFLGALVPASRVLLVRRVRAGVGTHGCEKCGFVVGAAPNPAVRNAGRFGNGVARGHELGQGLRVGEAAGERVGAGERPLAGHQHVAPERLARKEHAAREAQR